METLTRIKLRSIKDQILIAQDELVLATEQLNQAMSRYRGRKQILKSLINIQNKENGAK